MTNTKSQRGGAGEGLIDHPQSIELVDKYDMYFFDTCGRLDIPCAVYPVVRIFKGSVYLQPRWADFFRRLHQCGVFVADNFSADFVLHIKRAYRKRERYGVFSLVEFFHFFQNFA